MRLLPGSSFHRRTPSSSLSRRRGFLPSCEAHAVIWAPRSLSARNARSTTAIVPVRPADRRHAPRLTSSFPPSRDQVEHVLLSMAPDLVCLSVSNKCSLTAEYRTNNLSVFHWKWSLGYSTMSLLQALMQSLASASCFCRKTKRSFWPSTLTKLWSS